MIPSVPRTHARRDAASGAIACALGAALLGALLVIKGLPGVGANAPQRISVLLPSAGGLQEGDEVRASGVIVGRVTSLALEPGGVTATLALHRALDLREDAEFGITDRSVLGGCIVDVRPGKGAPARGNAFRGAMPATLFDVIGDVMDRRAPGGGAPGLIENLNDLAKALDERRGVLGELYRGTLQRDIAAIANAPAADRESLARMLSADSELTDALNAIGREVRAIRGDDSAAAVLLAMASSKDSPVARDVSEISAAVSMLRDAVAEGRGSAGLLSSDDPFWQRIDEVRGLFADLGRKGEGALAWLLGPEGRAALDDIGASFRDIKYLLSRGAAARLGDGPGMGGVLFDVIAFLAGDDKDRREQSMVIPVLGAFPSFFFHNTGLMRW